MAELIHEAGDGDLADPDAGAAGSFGVASDRIHVPAEPVRP